MSQSDYVFELGAKVSIGDHGKHDYDFVTGSPMVDAGESSYTFVSGTGIGGGTGKATLLAIAGRKDDGNVTTTVEEYENGSWAYIDDLPSKVQNAASTSDLDGFHWVMGGEDGNYSDLTSVYYWDGIGWQTGPDLPEEKVFADATVTPNNEIIISGSYGASYQEAGATTYKLTNSGWTQLPDLNTPRLGPAMACDPSGNVYVMGGKDDTDTRIASVEMYDGNGWSYISDMNHARNALAGATDGNGNVYAIAGKQPSGDVTDAFEKWDGSSWTDMSDTPIARMWVDAATGENGNVYLVAGENGNYGAEAELQEWDGSTWTQLEKLDLPRMRHMVTGAHPYHS